MRFTKFHILISYFLLSTTILCSQVKNIGLPDIRNYKKSDYKGGTQNWDIDQDKNGNLYFANNNGLFQFDGSSWRKYNLPNSTAVRCLKIDKSGKIFVGGYNEFGYFKANEKGKLIYFSISNRIKKENSKIIDNIWKIHIYNDEVIFQAFAATYIYKNDTLKSLIPPHRFQFSFLVNNKLYIQDISKGLLLYKNGKLSPIIGTTSLNNTEIWGMFKLSTSKILITTLDKGLFTYENGILSPWKTEANEFIKKNSSLGGIVIHEKYIVLNSILNGIIICNLNGKIIQHINRAKGLQNNTVLTSFIDSKNNLWLGLDNGISFIAENSPFTYFGFSYNLSTVYASVIYKDNLYVATNQGLFYHSWQPDFKESPFELVEGTTGQAWNIQVIDGQLFCAHNKGALLISGNKSYQTLDGIGYWSFKQIPNNPKYIIGSNYLGFSLFEKTNGSWHFKNKIKGLNKSIGGFELDDKSIWIKKDNVVSQLQLSRDLLRFKNIKSHQNLSDTLKEIESIQNLNNKVYFQKNNRFFKYSYEQELFYEDKKLSKLFKNIPSVSLVYQDNLHNLWYLFNESLGVLTKSKKGTYKNVVAPFSKLTGNMVYNSLSLSINTTSPNNTFIGLTDGLAHYDSNFLNNYEAKPKAYLRSLSFPGDTIIIGNGQKISDNYKIPYASNHVKFTFSSPSYENLDNLEFSYQLEGFDKQWSNWSTNIIKEYTNLKERDYTMKVKARNNYGIQSEQTKLNFTISPPWYRHFLAYLLYILLIIAPIYFIQRRIKIKIRKNRHYETIEQRRQYLEKESKIRQEQYQLEKEIEKLKSDKLQIKISSKDKELVNNSLQVVKTNKILNEIICKLKDINVESFDESTKFQFSKLNKSIVKEVNTDKSWKDLEKHIKNVHFDFLKRLKEKYPTISPRELDLSTYLLMNMSTKEIAEIMNISNGGVELARYRLRKKLGLNKKENLIGFLMSI